MATRYCQQMGITDVTVTGDPPSAKVRANHERHVV
jgi:hypothetical protein